MKEYLDHLIPEFSEVWSVNEMMVNIKDTEPTGVGFYSWIWTIISPQSRFIIASEVSKRREVNDAKTIFESGKKKSESILQEFLNMLRYCTRSFILSEEFLY